MIDHPHALYPLTFRPELKDKVWGGRRLGEVLGKQLPPDVPIGESWEAYGGSVVEDGALAGHSVDELVEEYGERLVGTTIAGLRDKPFPLLFKYIDASEFLSVQVHPDDSYAAEHTGYPYGKTEAWYIVHADPGAKIVHGWKRATTAEEVEAAVRENRLEELLEYVEVSPGDAVFVPAGTVHALGGQIVLGEIQQSSDTTYRLYDWGRMGFDGKPRELHVEESLRTLLYEETREHTVTPLRIEQGGATRTVLLACRYFAAEVLEGSAPLELELDGERFELLSALPGDITLEWDGGSLVLGRGRTALLPAALGSWRASSPEGYKLLRMYPPDLLSDVVRPLREAGYSDEEIVRLGGDARTNDLSPVLDPDAHAAARV